MLDRHEAHDDRKEIGHDVKHRDAVGDTGMARPPADREVPLGGMAAAEDASMMAIHQWLDGELDEVEAQRADANQVALWNQIADETARRRRMVTPSHVAVNIMNALPAAAVTANVAPHAAADPMVAPTANRASVSMTAVMVIGTALFAVGMLIGKML